MRRGLMGEIAYRLDALIPAKYFISAIVFFAYIFVAFWFVSVARRSSPVIGAFFLMSPLGIIFPLYEQAAFGRKDIFILLAMALSVMTCLRVHRQWILPTIYIIYLIAGLIVETALLYFPLAILIFLVVHGENDTKWYISISFYAAVFLLACIGMLYFLNHDLKSIGDISLQQIKIMESWQKLYSIAYPDRNAVTWLGWPLKEGMRMAFFHQLHLKTLFGYFIAAILALLPVILYMSKQTNYFNGIRQVVFRLGTFISFAAMAASFAVGADWGRYIHLYSLHVFAFFVVTGDVFFKEDELTNGDIAAYSIICGLYASTWQVKHFVFGGETPFVPGIIFNLLGVS